MVAQRTCWIKHIRYVQNVSAYIIIHIFEDWLHSLHCNQLMGQLITTTNQTPSFSKHIQSHVRRYCKERQSIFLIPGAELHFPITWFLAFSPAAVSKIHTWSVRVQVPLEDHTSDGIMELGGSGCTSIYRVTKLRVSHSIRASGSRQQKLSPWQTREMLWRRAANLSGLGHFR